MSGWIKLHRDLRKWKYYKKDGYVKLWLHMLLEANYSEESVFDGFGNEIKKGQFSTGRKRLESETGLNASKVERILKKLEIEQQIEQRKTNQCRIITVLNWEKYQYVDSESNNERTTSEQRVNNQRTQNKKLKKLKKENNNIYIVEKQILELWNSLNLKKWTGTDLQLEEIGKFSKKFKYPKEEIKKSIKNYAEVLHNEKKFFNYQWTLGAFLSGGHKNFVSENFSDKDFLKDSKTNDREEMYARIKRDCNIEEGE